jgi:hypothetical protein
MFEVWCKVHWLKWITNDYEVAEYYSDLIDETPITFTINVKTVNDFFGGMMKGTVQ